MGGVSMEWKEVRLGDVCSELSDGLHKAPKFIVNGEYIFVNAKNLYNGYILDNDPTKKTSHEEYLKYKKPLGKHSILYSIDGTIGNIAKYRGEKCVLGKGACYINCNPEIVESSYLYYQLQSPHFKSYIHLMSTGSTIKHISLKTMRDYVFELPSLEDQRRIASILSSLDRKIELNNKINADLEEMAQAIFKNWFVDFEPFKDGKFVDSELGMIPEGWKVISLNEILDNVSGYSYKGSELQSSNIAMATIKNFERKGGFKTEGYKEIVISKKIKETQFVNMFDVLVAHTDLTQNAEIVGNPAIVLSKGGYEKLIMSMDLTKVISKIDGVTNGLLYCILSTSRFKEHALGYVNGTTVLHMSKKAVPEYTCAFPKDINQIRDLCITLDSIYKRMAVTYDENSRLSTLRDTLLPRLMSGELEVPE